jgi:hypothetical protein
LSLLSNEGILVAGVIIIIANERGPWGHDQVTGSTHRSRIPPEWSSCGDRTSTSPSPATLQQLGASWMDMSPCLAGEARAAMAVAAMEAACTWSTIDTGSDNLPKGGYGTFISSSCCIM